MKCITLLEQLMEDKATKAIDDDDDDFEARQATADDELSSTSMIVLKARVILVSLSPSSSTLSLEVSESSEFFTFLTAVKSSILLESLTMSIVLILLAIITGQIEYIKLKLKELQCSEVIIPQLFKDSMFNIVASLTQFLFNHAYNVT